MKTRTKQWYRALVGTIVMMLMVVMSSNLWMFAKGFLKILGLFFVSLIYFIMLYINYNFIKWHDAKIERDKKNDNLHRY